MWCTMTLKRQVPHNCLLSKLKSYGFTGIKLDQQFFYLTEGKRWLFVVPLLNGHQLLVQGSVVGPTLFIIYVT